MSDWEKLGAELGRLEKKLKTDIHFCDTVLPIVERMMKKSILLEWLEEECIRAVKAIKTIKEENEFDKGFKEGAIQATINILADAKFDIDWKENKTKKKASGKK